MSTEADGSMMGSMMWQGPEQMRAACRDWVATDGAGDASGPQGCDEMVEWMDGHLTSRDGR
ncbi:MAG: hypothetical protein LH477_09900 [Nocardioides sp.]|nr:hypothetical protein [Nocardioides sp.]